MNQLNNQAVSVYLSLRTAVARFWRDQRGASVSTVLLIATLVVAVAIFAGIVVTQLQTAGTCVQNVDFTNGTNTAGC